MKADIFFFITSIAVILVSLGAAMVLYRLYKILGHVEHLSGQVAEESDLIREDIAHLRNDVRAGASRILSSFNFLRRVSSHGKRRGKKGSITNDDNANAQENV